MKPLLTLLPFEVTHQYVGKKEYEFFEDSMTVRGLPAGVYMIEVETQPATQVVRKLYYVSDVRVLMEALPEDKDTLCRGQCTTGQPLKDAHVRLMNNRMQTIETLTTDAQGEVMWQRKERRPQTVFAYTDTDKFCRTSSAFSSFNLSTKRHVERVEIFTDRAIYRPGQTVHAAAIAYATDNGYEHKVMENKTLTLTLRDANFKEVPRRS